MYAGLPVTAAGSIFVTCKEESEQTPTERVGRVVWALAHGEGLTTRQVASMAGITRRGALDMMCRLSRVIPIYQDEHDVWSVLFLKEM